MRCECCRAAVCVLLDPNDCVVVCVYVGVNVGTHALHAADLRHAVWPYVLSSSPAMVHAILRTPTSFCQLT